MTLEQTSFEKTLLSRNFCEERKGKNKCGNYGDSLSRIFGKNSVIAVLLKKLLKLKELIWRKRFLVREASSFFPQWEIAEILSHAFFSKSSWKQWFYKRNYKIVDLTKKFSVTENFLSFYIVLVHSVLTPIAPYIVLKNEKFIAKQNF